MEGATKHMADEATATLGSVSNVERVNLLQGGEDPLDSWTGKHKASSLGDPALLHAIN